MRGLLPASSVVKGFLRAQQPGLRLHGRRAIQISATPTSERPAIRDPFGNYLDAATDPADARFEVLGAPYSLLSVSLSASQKLYTRRGTLVGVSGKAENAQSTLKLLSPLLRLPLGVPFLYQRLTSTTPLTALISTKSPITTVTSLHLDGTTDWRVANRSALLAWTGHTLSVSPTVNTSLSLAHWGNTNIAGRGLVALSGHGQIYQVTLERGEEFVAAPGNVVAYSVNANAPSPYRFKSSSLNFQVPTTTGWLSSLLPDVKFFRVMRETPTWRFFANIAFSVRTALRRTIWGDRLFLRFQGPGTILMSSRASRISDVLTTSEINEIADSPPGAVQQAVKKATTPKDEVEVKPAKRDVPTAFKAATVGADGKVKFEDAKNAGEFTK